MDDGKRQTVCGFCSAHGVYFAVFGLRGAGGRQPGHRCGYASRGNGGNTGRNRRVHHAGGRRPVPVLYLYGELPGNFITKAEARELGWDGGGLEDVAPGKCIGGDYFGNYEGLLPAADGRTYFECDINTLGANSRGPERIVYSSDGLVYYTADHYESFTLLYGEATP